MLAEANVINFESICLSAATKEQAAGFNGKEQLMEVPCVHSEAVKGSRLSSDLNSWRVLPGF